MKNKIEFDKLENLLLTKSFSELNELERESVQEVMSESEYSAQRILLLEVANVYRVDNNIHLNPKNKQLLLNKMLPESKSKIYTLANFKIPAYQVAAVLAIFTIALFMDKGEIIYRDKYVKITKQDTIVVTQDVPRYIDRQKIVYKYKNTDEVKNIFLVDDDSINNSLYCNAELSQYNSDIMLSNIETSQSGKKGFSNGDDTIYKYLSNLPRF